MSQPALLISMPEIAELASVRRPVVTTWRRRHVDFPAPVSVAGSRPMFDADAVREWLVSTGRADRDIIEPELRLHTLVALGRRVPAKRLIEVVTALICLRELDGEPLSGTHLADRSRAADPGDAFLLSEITSITGELRWLPGEVDELVEAAWGGARAFERILVARSRWPDADLPADAVTPALAELMAGLSGVREIDGLGSAPVLADPAAGAGDLLVAVLDAIGEHLSR